MPDIITADQLQPGQQGTIINLCPDLDGKTVVMQPDGKVVGTGGTTWWTPCATKTLQVIPVMP